MLCLRRKKRGFVLWDREVTGTMRTLATVDRAVPRGPASTTVLERQLVFPSHPSHFFSNCGASFPSRRAPTATRSRQRCSAGTRLRGRPDHNGPGNSRWRRRGAGRARDLVLGIGDGVCEGGESSDVGDVNVESVRGEVVGDLEMLEDEGRVLEPNW